MSTSALHIRHQRPTNTLLIVVHAAFAGAMVNVWWAQWPWWWQSISMLVIGIGYVNWLRKHVTFTHPQAVRAVTLRADGTVMLHYAGAASPAYTLVAPATILSWVILLTGQLPQRRRVNTVVLWRYSMPVDRWRKLRLRLLYSSSK